MALAAPSPIELRGRARLYRRDRDESFQSWALCSAEPVVYRYAVRTGRKVKKNQLRFALKESGCAQGWALGDATP